MDKISKYVLLGVVALLSIGLVLDRVNNPPTGDRQADSLGKRIFRTLSNWGIDNLMRERPPETPDRRPRRDPQRREDARQLEMVRQYQTLPIVQPSELMTHDGGELDHSRGW